MLTGDRPTGPLHLGHYVGTLRSRVALQDDYQEPEALIPEIGRLPGTNGDPKMGGSRSNAIDLFDDEETVLTKVMAMYTDPRRIHTTDPGQVEGNPVFAYRDAFNADAGEVSDLKERYRAGRVGDVEVTRCLARALSTSWIPFERDVPSSSGRTRGL